MSAVLQRCSLERFRRAFADRKPNFEYWDGEPRQKAMPTKLHAKLQRILATLLAELGFCSFTELSLRIDPNWEPVPDVTATANDFPGPYPVEAVDIVTEILSPEDSFTATEAKCERYAANGIPDVLVFDPIGQHAWKWDAHLASLVRLQSAPVLLTSRSTELSLTTVWTRFESER